MRELGLVQSGVVVSTSVEHAKEGTIWFSRSQFLLLLVLRKYIRRAELGMQEDGRDLWKGGRVSVSNIDFVQSKEYRAY